MFFIEFLVVLAMMVLGARYGGIFFGMVGGFGLALLVIVFKLAPASPPINVMLIMMSVVLAASTLQSAGGMDYMVRIAEKMLRKHPGHITFIAPLIAWVFTFVSGTGNVLYNVLPVIAEVARESKVRPERPISIAVIASQHAVPSSPISAATVALAAMLGPHGISILTILAIVIPSTLVGLLVGAFSVRKMGLNLEEDPEYLEKMRAGLVESGLAKRDGQAPATRAAKLSVVFFLVAAVVVVLFGTFEWLRPEVVNAKGETSRVGMTQMIEIVMLVIAGFMVMFCKADVNKIITSSVFRAGMMGIVTVFGLAWMSDTLIANNLPMLKDSVARLIEGKPYLFALALFFISALTHSQGATVAALMPLGLTLGIPPIALVAMFPAVCGYFIIPSTGVLLAGVAFDTTGTTKIGKWVVNHSYMRAGMIVTFVSVITGMVIQSVFF